ncbi:MAG: hypothetical protein GY801_35615 [bacterium]|nr:hypothetical protein [bacterium]
MKKYVLCLCMICLLPFQFSVDISAQESTGRIDDSEDIVHAKVGIRITSNAFARRAKAEDRIKAGDKLRIYIHPGFDDAMVYVIYSNRQQLVPLYQERLEGPGIHPLILPLQAESYTVDGQSQKEKLTIICSPEPLAELDEFLHAQEQQQRPPDAWKELEEALLEQSKLDLSETISKPWSIAGASRSIDPFFIKLPIFSGKTFVIKKYDFLVEK